MNSAALAIMRRMKRGYITTLQREYPETLQREYHKVWPTEGQPGPGKSIINIINQPAYQQASFPQAQKPPAKEEEEKISGIELEGDISDTDTLAKAMGESPEGAQLKNVDIKYALIPRNPTGNQRVFAYANIRWSDESGELIYYVIEPELSKYDMEIIESTKKVLEEKLDIDFFKLGEIKAKDLLRQETEKILRLTTNLDPAKAESLMYFIDRDIVGLGKLAPLINDPNIEDISCDGINIPLYAYHRNPDIGSLKTNVVFTSADELNSFVMKMAQRARKSISIAEPLLDAALPDGSRIQATLGTDIARRGSNFTIRKFAEEPLTPTHMLRYGTLDSTQLAYLWLAIDNGQSMLISGGTATGKTSMLNALSLFIRPNLKIVSIEDTPELRLPHPHWIPEVARSPLSIKGTTGEVSLFDLLKSSLRQRPDYIVMGEVRGKEAFVLFQQMASIPGEEKVLVLNGNNLKKIDISKVESGREYRVPTFDPLTGEVRISNLKMMVKHAPVDELYRITTRTGRNVVATRNHSVFTFSGEMEPVTVSELREGDDIAIPARLPCGYNDITHLDLLRVLPDIRVYSPKLIKEASRKLGFERASKVAGFTTISNYYGVNNCALPAKAFKRLMKEAGIGYKPEDMVVRFERGASVKTSPMLEITPELLRLMGYYISEGSLNKARRNNGISLYSNNEEILEDMRTCIRKVSGKKTRERKTHGFGTATELTFSHKTLFELLKATCGHGSGRKRVPDFVHGLSKERISHLLAGLYSGDAYLGERYFGYYTISKELANDVSNLLLTLGIVSTIRERKRKGRKTTDYEVLFYKSGDRREFLRHVSPVGKKPVIRTESKKDARVKGDIFLDRIKSIERIGLDKPVPVYDLSVPGTQNFIGGFGGVVLHNTGHPSLATIHAASINQLVDRLTTPPISLPPSLIENINTIVFLTLSRLGGKYVRRANKILEVTGIEKDRPKTNTIFKWVPKDDRFRVDEKSPVLKTIAERMALSDSELRGELSRRRAVIEWMYKMGIFNYVEFARVISAYYNNPDKVMKIIEGQ